MITFKKYGELYDKLLRHSASVDEFNLVMEFGQMQPEFCPGCRSLVFSKAGPGNLRCVHDVVGCVADHQVSNPKNLRDVYQIAAYNMVKSRETKKLSIKDVAERMHISGEDVVALESGACKITLRQLDDYANAVGSLAQFFLVGPV